jgi:hypothetical protein
VSGPDIFLSYCREDRAAAKHFAECFVREGFSVWWDAALRSGQTFDEVIEKELRAAKAVVVLWSPRSVASRWVRAEATLADRSNKLVPAIIESCDRPIIFELTHAADLADWTGDISDVRWRTLVHDLSRLVHSGTKEEESALADAAKLDAQPKPGLAAFADPRLEPPVPASGRKPASRANVDDLVFAPVSRRDSGRRTPPPEEDLEDDSDLTQFGKKLEGFGLGAGDGFHYLEMIDGVGRGTRFVVSPLGLKIGRTAPADIILADSGVSRNHCVVQFAGSDLRVLDLNSTNGTYIDGERVDREAKLAIGSVLRVGKVSFKHEFRTGGQLQRDDDADSFGRPGSRVVKLARTS